jgi:Rod binding domain-containing protein
MNILPAAPAASMLPLSDDRALHVRPGASVEELATQFEGVFVSMLLKTMRETMTSGEMFGGDSADVWGGIFDQHMGEAMARAGGLGLMDQLAPSTGSPPTTSFPSLF